MGEAQDALIHRPHQKPFRPARLLGPGDQVGRHMYLLLSDLDECLWWHATEPAESLREQLMRGPITWSMFFSCVGFVVPAMVHLYFHEHTADICAALALLCVSVSSPLCDAFLVYGNVFDDGKPDPETNQPAYQRTAVATGKTSDEIIRMINEKGADKEIRAADYYNNMSRLCDRATCAVLVGPAVAFYCLYQRPQMFDTLVFIAIFAVGWTTCFVDQQFRRAHPIGVRWVKRSDGSGEELMWEKKFWIHHLLHIVWHIILIFLFTASALYRPVYKSSLFMHSH